MFKASEVPAAMVDFEATKRGEAEEKAKQEKQLEQARTRLEAARKALGDARAKARHRHPLLGAAAEQALDVYRRRRLGQ